MIPGIRDVLSAALFYCIGVFKVEQFPYLVLGVETCYGAQVAYVVTFHYYYHVILLIVVACDSRGTFLFVNGYIVASELIECGRVDAVANLFAAGCRGTYVELFFDTCLAYFVLEYKFCHW